MLTIPRWFNNPKSIPLSDIHTLTNTSLAAPILIVAPHPDDETLGCGGAIALLRQLNLPVKVLIVSDGTKSHPNSLTHPTPMLKQLREQESLAALKILGVDLNSVTFWEIKDGAIAVEGKSSSLIALCNSFLNNLRPSSIFLPWRFDPHADHRASWQIFSEACQNLANQPRIIEYPVWDWDSEQRGNFPDSVKVWRLDIRNVLPLKIKAIAQYLSQISDLISDDPQGFRLTPEMLQNFKQPWEIYLELRL